MSIEPREADREPALKVVVNHEGQYSLWPADRANPPGWDDAGCAGTKAECLDFIERNWSDMRPLSLRRAGDAPGRPAPAPGGGDANVVTKTEDS